MTYVMPGTTEDELPLTPELVSQDGVYPHCPCCGFTPIEGMREYLLIHGSNASCVVCGRKLDWVVKV